MKIVNLTPHVLNIVNDVSVSVPPSGDVARVSVVRTPDGLVDVDGASVPVNISTYGDITGLPAPKDGVIYIVSALVAQVANRPDVFYPDDLVRDDQGRVVGARGLARY